MAAKNYTIKFKGKLDGKTINDFVSQLDYEIKDTNERVKLVRDILYPDGELDEYFLEYFNQDIENADQTQPYFKVNLNSNSCLSEDNNVCKKLEQMANYILYNKEECDKEDENIIKPEYKTIEYTYLDTNDERKIKRNEKKSYEVLSKKYDSNGLTILEKEMKNNKNVKLKPKQKMTKYDLENKYLRQIQDAIDYYKVIHDNIKILKTDTESEIKAKKAQKSKLKQAMIQLKDTQIMTKEKLYRTIEFKAILPDTTKISYDEDSGYYDENDDYIFITENRIDLSNHLHIYYLLEFYSDLRMCSWENSHSDIRYVLDSLDYLIENCGLKDFEKDILIWKVDRLSREQMSDNLKLKYGLDCPVKYISSLYKNMITRKIAKYNDECFEDWFFYNRAIGKYRRCSKCGKVKLANKNHFSPNKYGKDGLYSTCKKCDVERKKR